MKYKPTLHFNIVPEWPPLAWLARCDADGGSAMVFHGGAVDVFDNWFGEIVWAGDYHAADFDHTDIVAGSGGRIRDGKITFVSPGSTVDRLSFFESDEFVWVSNSLCCLLAALDSKIDATYSRYLSDLKSIILGLDRYRRSFDTSVGQIQLVYFHNLVWDGARLKLEPKPNGSRDFSSFLDYRGFLTTSLREVAANMLSPARPNQYKFLGTLSSGYDSPTVAVLARPYGFSEVICISEARGGDDDSGEPIAKLLGLNPILLDRNNWRKTEMPEVPFIAGDAQGGDVVFKGAESFLRGRVLLTGFQGDKVWNKEVNDLSANLLRADQSGLDLTEYRLQAGFIHCPLPFWGAREIGKINQISRSVELEKWNVKGDYNRPISRRIVEEAGVPREMFGVKKKAALDAFYTSFDFLTPGSMDAFLSWLGKNDDQWTSRGRIPPLRNLVLDRWKQRARHKLRDISSQRRFFWRLSDVIDDTGTALRNAVFPWAVEETIEIYRRGYQRIS